MTLLWFMLFVLFGSDWGVTLGFGPEEFSTAATWLCICVAVDLAGGVA